MYYKESKSSSKDVIDLTTSWCYIIYRTEDNLTSVPSLLARADVTNTPYHWLVAQRLYEPGNEELPLPGSVVASFPSQGAQILFCSRP